MTGSSTICWVRTSAHMRENKQRRAFLLLLESPRHKHKYTIDKIVRSSCTNADVYPQLFRARESWRFYYVIWIRHDITPTSCKERLLILAGFHPNEKALPVTWSAGKFSVAGLFLFFFRSTPWKNRIQMEGELRYWKLITLFFPRS